MSAVQTTESSSRTSPRLIARITGAFYLLNIVTALYAFYGRGGHDLMLASGFVATAAYIAVAVLLYYLLRPVNSGLSLIAALFSLAGCIAGVLSPLHLDPFHIHPLVFFGFYCVLAGYLIYTSTFLARIVGALMIVAGVGWLTFLSPRLSTWLTPYHFIAGGIGEGFLTLWLLVFGVDSERWKARSRIAGLWR